MLYHLVKGIAADIPGSGVFDYISFRAGMALIISLVISMWFGKGIVRLLQRMQVGETVRDLGLEGQVEKQGTPTMGGLIIIAATVVPTLLFARLDNIYILLMLLATLWLGAIGFVDDYIKVFKKDKRGLAGMFKVIGQVGIGLVIGLTVYFHPSIRTKVEVPQVIADQFQPEEVSRFIGDNGDVRYLLDRRQPNTTIPFVKGNELNYSSVMGLLGREARQYTWILYVLVVVFIITAVSNGANITDGIDGLAAGTSAIIVLALGVLTYIGGNIVFAQYLDVMYIPGIGELVVFVGALLGACIGFLWYNAYPAQVFMGDTGSLALGGVIAALAILVRKELLIPVLCGVFVVENLSVMLQVSWFKYTRKRFGTGRRIFLMAPLHHHYQKLGYHESKIVTRFLIVGVMLAVLTLVTLKLR